MKKHRKGPSAQEKKKKNCALFAPETYTNTRAHATNDIVFVHKFFLL